MKGKIKIDSVLEVVTGLHIGGSKEFSPIGAVDSPVIQDPRTNMPIIPGSSLKGKMRTLLAKYLSEGKLRDPNNDPEEVKRLFGSSEPIQVSRLLFADSFVCNAQDLAAVGLREVKFENVIDRMSCQANPRQIERVISGVRFNVVIVYDLPENEEEIETDMKNLTKAMKLLQVDYLGGHGTSGSGRVSFKTIDLKAVESDIPQEEVGRLKELFKEVEAYELLSM